MENKKTDESVKTGLQIEADHAKSEDQVKGTIIGEHEDAGKEEDIDDMVHEQLNEVNEVDGEQDIDELVHDAPPSTTTTDNNEERDIDDLVHEK